jgi:transposase
MNLILKEVDNGASVRQVAEKFDISWSTVFRAKKLAKENQ